MRFSGILASLKVSLSIALRMNTFTTIHVLLSLIGIASGLVIVFGLILSKAMPRWTLLFIVTTLATSISGFFFPFHGFTPAIGLGIVSVVILLAVIAARYSFHMLKGWRWVFVIGTVAAFTSTPLYWWFKPS